MKLKLSNKLNIIHIIHFTVIVFVILIINLFVFRKSLTIKLSYALEANSENVMFLLNDKLDDIALHVDEILEINSKQDIRQISIDMQVLAKHPLIDTIEIHDQSMQPEQDWIAKKEGEKIHFVYSRQIGDEHELVVFLKRNWIETTIKDIRRDPAFFYAIVDQEKNIYYATDSTITEADLELIYTQSESDLLTHTDKQIHLINRKKTRFAQTVSSDHINLHFITYFKYSFIEYLRSFSKIILIELIIILTLTLTMIVRTNIRFTRPLQRIISNLKENKYISLKNIASHDEALIIQKSLDSLENQLKFYIKNLERNAAEKKKIEKDIQLAKRLQKNILPKQDSKLAERCEFKIASSYEAAFQLGGDLYDYFLIDDKNLMFVVADIAGKGIPASLFMIFTHTLLKNIAKPGIPVSGIVEKLNNKLLKENISDLFVTLFLGQLNLENGQLQYCNAAHNSPVLIKHSGELIELQEVHGIPVGIYSDRKYAMSEVQLEKDDQLFIYTDGLVDTKDENEMNYAVDVLKFNLMGAWFNEPDEIVDKIEKSVKSFRGNKSPGDDMTLLAIKYTPED